MNRLVIVGAGGHGKVIADIALKNGYTDINFVDDNATGRCIEFSIIGTTDNLEALNDCSTDFVIAIGNNSIRRKISESHAVNWIKLIHPSAQVGCGAMVREGTVVMAGAVINPDARIGRHCIINSCAVIEHDNKIGDFVHVSPNAALGGTVCVGDNSHIGIGATVRNNLTIGKNTVIGAGAMVVKDLTESTTYVGIPAKKLGGGVTRNSVLYSFDRRYAA
ncbi:acetyltransferase [Blautia marasmi]|uniref:acetyltransferase n=1 Tax=Blautia marasmi TaxID=1917868 RepID=UPI000CF26C1D|nr:acetyltransferase [Blautia marasmi]